MQRMNPTRRALLVTLGAMLLRLPLGWAAGQIPGVQDDPAVYYAAVILQEMLLWGLPALLLRPWGSERLKQDRCTGLCVWAVLLGMAAQMAFMPLTEWWSGLTGANSASVLLPRNEIQWVLAVFALVVVPALTEEAFFRGGLMTGLYHRLGTCQSLMLSTLIFALMHGSLAGFPAHMGISLLCGLGMMRCGKLRVSVIMHMAYNGAALLLSVYPVPFLPALPLGLVLAAACLWMIQDVCWRRGRYALRVKDWAMLLTILAGTMVLYLPEILL